MSDDLPTHLWVQAGLTQCSTQGISAMVLNKGDPHTGTVLVKIALLDGTARLLTRRRDLDGILRWEDALSEVRPSEPDADAAITRAKSRDPDLWIIEIEDRKGQNPFES